MTIDTTVAGTSADSYLTVAAADLFAAADLGPEVTTWLAAVTGDKEKALKRATREIDGFLRTGWSMYLSTQALLFPRSLDVSGSTPFIPRKVQLACYEQATFVLKNAAVMDNARTRRARDVASASEPNIAFSEKTAGETPVMSDAALLYLEGYGVAGGSRGMRSLRVSSGFVST